MLESLAAGTMLSAQEIGIECAIDELGHILDKVETAAKASLDRIRCRFATIIHGLRVREAELCAELNVRLMKIQNDLALKWKELSVQLSMIRSHEIAESKIEYVGKMQEYLSSLYGIDHCMQVSFPSDFSPKLDSYGSFDDQNGIMKKMDVLTFNAGDETSANFRLFSESTDSVSSVSYWSTMQSPSQSISGDDYCDEVDEVDDFGHEFQIENTLEDCHHRFSETRNTPNIDLEILDERKDFETSLRRHQLSFESGSVHGSLSDNSTISIDESDTNVHENWASPTTSTIFTALQRHSRSTRSSIAGSESRKIIPWGVKLSGASGLTGPSINGEYDPAVYYTSDMPAYQKRGDPDKWLKYHPAKQAWFFTALSTHGDEEAWARAPCPSGAFPESCSGGWQLCDYGGRGNSSKTAGSGADSTSSVAGSIGGSHAVQQSIASNAAAAGEPPGGELWCRSYPAAINERAIAVTSRNLAAGSEDLMAIIETDNWISAPSISVTPIASSLHVRGAHGRYAAFINGIYDPTSEWSGGQLLFRKREICLSESTTGTRGGSIGRPGSTGSTRWPAKSGISRRLQSEDGGDDGDSATWLAYHPEAHAWHVKPTSALGKDHCWAFLESELVAPPDRITDIWHLHSGQEWVRAPSMRILPEAAPVRLHGAVGPNAVAINGVYDPTEELCCGMPVYKKRGGSSDRHKWLEYYEEDYKGGRELGQGIVVANTNPRGRIQKWVVKATSQRRTEHGWASISCSRSSADTLPSFPEQCVGVWRVFDGIGMHPQPSLKATSLSACDATAQKQKK